MRKRLVPVIILAGSFAMFLSPARLDALNLSPPCSVLGCASNDRISLDDRQGGSKNRTFIGFEVKARPLPKGLPAWFKLLDADGDGQIGLYEWRAAGKSFAEFAEYDLNDDGFIEPEEVLRVMRRPIEFKNKKNEVSFESAVEEEPENRHRGKKSFKILAVKLDAGKTYHFVMHSKVFQSFLYLEDSDGNVLTENSASTIGGISRIEYRAAKAGEYRIIATSLGGFRTGPFVLSIRR